MHGVIAGGSQPTVDAGAAILERGGNAADAAVAACFATSAGEPTLTSLAGAGIMIYRDAKSGEVTVCDFFSDAPRLGPHDVHNLDFTGIDLDFGPTTQHFKIGAGSAAVPGVIPGLCEVLERWGTMPLSEVIKPTCSFLREGVLLGDYQGVAAKLLEPILTYTESARSVFATRGRMIRKGDVFTIPQLADTLESLATDGWRKHYDEVLCKAMVDQFGPHAGGLLTAEDFSEYEVRFNAPLELRYHNSQVLTMPPPAAGGTMIGLMLALLHEVDLGTFAPLSVEHARMLGAAMTVADEARSDGLAALSKERLAHWRARFDTLRARDALPLSQAVPGPDSTTHVSVIDAEGNAAGVTFSYGEGNAHIIGNSGIMMNNLMGEEDIHPDGFGHSPKGQRLPTMMSPSLMIDDGGGVTVLGTGGANRIRTAIVQVVSLLLDHRYEAQQAVSSPRMHYESGVLNAETFEMDDNGDALEGLGATKFVRFPERNLFFGGVHMVRRGADGKLTGAGDPRRGGVCRVV
jgi:gamma-glutamyltranspeptidase/glutathione hydrolase